MWGQSWGGSWGTAWGDSQEPVTGPLVPLQAALQGLLAVPLVGAMQGLVQFGPAPDSVYGGGGTSVFMQQIHEEDEIVIFAVAQMIAQGVFK